MALEFKCQNCGTDIIVKFVKVGETARCRSCGAENVVPETAVETDQEPDSSHVEEPTSVASTDTAKANKRIKQAWIAGVISGVITLIAILQSVAGVDILGFGIHNLLDVTLIFGLAYGIYRKSRVCAVIMFVYFVGNRILMLVESGKPSGLVMAALFGYWFFQGIRGTFGYHKLEPTVKKLKAKTVLLVFGWVFFIIVVFFLVTYYDKGQYDRAIWDYNKAIEINPKGTVAYINRGNVYAANGQYNRAISDYTKAIEINSKDTAAYINRGIAYYYTQRYDKAWDDVDKAQSLGAQIQPGFLKALREASGRQR